MAAATSTLPERINLRATQSKRPRNLEKVERNSQDTLKSTGLPKQTHPTPQQNASNRSFAGRLLPHPGLQHAAGDARGRALRGFGRRLDVLGGGHAWALVHGVQLHVEDQKPSRPW